MAVTYTTEQVLALAADAQAADTARKTAAPRKWSALGGDGRACWGLAAGSGKEPYQTAVDLTEPAFRCTCPSRKFPCKHGLALLLLLAERPGDFAMDAPPEWVTAWLAKRDERAEKQAAKAADPAPPAVTDAAAQEQRVSARDEKVAGGLAELGVWLGDLVRQGLADLPAQGYQPWDRMATRLVDAQCGSLARQVRQLGALALGGVDWEARLLARLGRLQLLLAAYERLDALAPELAEDVRAAIGYTQNQRDLLATGIGWRDTWQVLARRVTLEERLRVQRCWLRGTATGRCALVLDFAHGDQPLDVSLTPGLDVDAELVFYPSAWPQRALVRERTGEPRPSVAASWHVSAAAALADYAAALARHPWLERFPMALAAAQVHAGEGHWWLLDAQGQALPLAAEGMPYWSLLAATAGRPTTVMGEWDGECLAPLAVALDGVWQALDAD